jgi:hypothetical protein
MIIFNKRCKNYLTVFFIRWKYCQVFDQNFTCLVWNFAYQTHPLALAIGVCLILVVPIVISRQIDKQIMVSTTDYIIILGRWMSTKDFVLGLRAFLYNLNANVRYIPFHLLWFFAKFLTRVVCKSYHIFIFYFLILPRNIKPGIPIQARIKNLNPSKSSI